MTIETLKDVEELEECVGARPAEFHLKSITYLDEHCATLLAASPFAVVGVVAGDGSLRSFTVGGDPGLFTVRDRIRLAVPGLDGADLPDGASAGLLAFVPGYRETLRINGRLRTGPDTTLEVEEAFLHCAKAIIRSRLWNETAGKAIEVAEGETSLSSADVAAFFDASPFVTLASVDDEGAADVSPKGDPPGLIAQIVDDHTLAIADRPGNRRTDTMHNLVTNDALSLLAFVPGSDLVIEARGRAAVTANEAILSSLAVNDKTPKAAIVLRVEHIEAVRSAGVAAARLWDTSRHADPSVLPKSTQIWVDHVKRNQDPGLAAKATRQMITTQLLDASITQDYRENLY